MGPFHVVAEGEEGVASQGDAGELGKPLCFEGGGQLLGADLEEPLPGVSLGKGGGVRDIQVDGVVTVGAADAVGKLELQHPGVLTQPPDIRLVSRQPCAVNAALLAGPYADGHAVLDVAHRIGLGVF